MMRLQRRQFMTSLLALAVAAMMFAEGAIAAFAARRGPVRIDGRAVRDDDGPFNALGASMFWLAWGYKFDRARLERNLQALAEAGVDYVRALGDVGPGEGWQDREVDSRWPDYEAVIAGATDLAYDRYGLRVQWTIFGGVEHQPTAAGRAAVVDRFATVARARPHKVFALEIANEASLNGFAGAAGRTELRALTRRLGAATDVLVAISAPDAADAPSTCALYGGGAADVVTMHYDRDVKGARGRWGPVIALVRSPLNRSVSMAGPPCPEALPAAVINNEPIGPGSSLADERDPLRLALAYVTTFAAGHAAYVLHAGPGVRGGGAADRERGRLADFTALPEFAAISRALVAAKRYTPAGLANWTSPREPKARPLDGLEAAIERGDLASGTLLVNQLEVFGVLLGIVRELTLTSRSAITLELVDPVDGNVLLKRGLSPGMTVTITPRARPDGDGLVLRGRMRVID